MAENRYDFSDPRRLFRLWKELSGEDLYNEIETPDNTYLNKNVKNGRIKVENSLISPMTMK